VNIKRGVNRLSIVLSGFWFLDVLFSKLSGSQMILINEQVHLWIDVIMLSILGIYSLWLVLHFGFWIVPWIISGFRDEDKTDG
jgi:hypothetical protein